MKKHIKLFFIGLIFAITLNAQNSSKPVIAIEMDSMRVLYAGLKNPLQIAYSGAINNQLNVESDLGSLTNDSLGNYFIDIPYDQAGRVVNISVYLNKEKESKKLIGTKQFRILAVPQPIPSFGSKSGGEISIGEIRLVNFVSLWLEDFAFEGLKFTVHKYTLTYIPKSGKISKINSVSSADHTQQIDNGQLIKWEGRSSAALTPDMQELLSNSKEGDRFIISDIWASFPEGDVIKLNNNIDLTVK